MPHDIGISSSVSKTCTACGETQGINAFLLVGSSRLSNGHIIEWILPDEAPTFPPGSNAFRKLLDRIFPRKWKLDDFPLFRD